MKEIFIVHPNYITHREAILQWLHSFTSEGDFVMEGNRNIIKKKKVHGIFLNAKKFKTPNIFQSLVYQFLRKSKAKRSFEYAIKLLDLGIKTPFPVAYYERFSLGLKESFYISLHIDYDLDFRVLNHHPNYPNRKEILEQMAAFTFQLHQNNIEFLDHSPGNTLIKEVEKLNSKDIHNKRWEFYLIDLNRMNFKELSFKQRMNNFRRLWLSKTMINFMAPVYAQLYGKSETETHQLMTLYSRKFQRKVNSKKLRRKKKKWN